MIKKFKNLDPMTKQTIINCTIQAAILAVCVVAVVKTDKAAKAEISI